MGVMEVIGWITITVMTIGLIAHIIEKFSNSGEFYFFKEARYDYPSYTLLKNNDKHSDDKHSCIIFLPKNKIQLDKCSQLSVTFTDYYYDKHSDIIFDVYESADSRVFHTQSEDGKMNLTFNQLSYANINLNGQHINFEKYNAYLVSFELSIPELNKKLTKFEFINGVNKERTSKKISRETRAASVGSRPANKEFESKAEDSEKPAG